MKGQYPYGIQAANTITKCIERYPNLFPEVYELQHLVNELSINSNRILNVYIDANRSPLEAIIKSHSAYTLLVPIPITNDSDEIDCLWLRAAGLLTIIHKTPLPSFLKPTRIKQIEKWLRKPEKYRVHTTTWVESLESAITSPEFRERDAGPKGKDIKTTLPQIVVKNVLRDLQNIAHSRRLPDYFLEPESKDIPEEKRVSREQLPPTDDLIGERIGAHADEAIGEQDEDQQQKRTLEFHFLRLQGALLVETEQTLTRNVFKHATSDLQHELLNTTQFSPIHLARLCLYLSFYNGRDWHEILRAIEHWYLCDYPETPDTPGFGVGTKSWKSLIPENHRHRQIKGNKIEYFQGANPSLLLPNPISVIEVMKHAKVLLSKFHNPAFDTDAITAEVIKRKNQFREQFNNGISDNRIRFTIASAIFRQCETLWIVQSIMGESLDHSTAPLHYYATPENEFIDVWVAALSWLDPDLHFESSRKMSQRICGAISASVDPAHIKTAVKNIVNDIPIVLRDRDPVHAMNAIYLYTARMFCAGTLHRLTSRLTEITAADIHLDKKLATGGDKYSEPSQACRLMALGNLLNSQISACLDMAVTVRSHLHLKDPNRYQNHIRAIDQMINGQTSLFQIIQDDGTSTPITRDILADGWKGLKVPLWVFRAFGASELNKNVQNRNDIYRQLGHATHIPHWSIDDLEHVIEWSDRLGENIDELLTNQGWQVFRPSMNDMTWSSVLLQIDPNSIVRDDKRWRSELKLSQKVYCKKVNKNTQRKREEIVKAELRLNIPEYDSENPPRSLKVSDEQIVSLTKKLEKLSNNTQEFADLTRISRKILKHHKKNSNWDTSLPPHVFWVRSEPSTVSPHCMRAVHWCERVRQTLINELSISNHSNGILNRDETSRVLALVIIDGGITDKTSLIAAIDAIPKAKPHPSRKDICLLPLTLGRDSGTPIQSSLYLRGVSALCVLQLRNKALSLNTDALENLDKCFREVIPSLSNQRRSSLDVLLECAGLAWRIMSRGTISAQLDGRLPSHNLSVERIEDIFIGRLRPPNPDALKASGGTDFIPDRNTLADKCRKAINNALSKNPESKILKTNDEAIHELDEVIIDYANNWCVIVAHWIRHEIVNGLAISSSYTYVTALMRKLVYFADRLSTDFFVAEELAALIEEVIYSATPKQQIKVSQLIFRLANFATELGWAEVSPDMVELEDIAEAIPTQPIILLDQEWEEAKRLLNTWKQDLQCTHAYYQFDQKILSDANLTVDITRIGALRSGETTHLTTPDITSDDQYIQIFVRTNRLHKLKSRASRRSIQINAHQSDELKSGLDERLNAAIPATNKVRPRLFAVDTSSPTLVNHTMIKRMAGLALTRVSPYKNGRIQSGRHRFVSQNIVSSVFPENICLRAPGLRHIHWETEYSDIGLKTLRVSRYVGHARPRTTHTHYSHLLGEIFSEDPIWFGTSKQQVIHLLHNSNEAIRKKIRRKNLNIKDYLYSSLVIQSTQLDKTILPTEIFITDDSLPDLTKKKDDGYQRLAKLLMDYFSADTAELGLSRLLLGLANDTTRCIDILCELSRYNAAHKRAIISDKTLSKQLSILGQEQPYNPRSRKGHKPEKINFIRAAEKLQLWIDKHPQMKGFSEQKLITNGFTRSTNKTNFATLSEKEAYTNLLDSMGIESNIEEDRISVKNASLLNQVGLLCSICRNSFRAF